MIFRKRKKNDVRICSRVMMTIFCITTHLQTSVSAFPFDSMRNIWQGKEKRKNKVSILLIRVQCITLFSFSSLLKENYFAHASNWRIRLIQQIQLNTLAYYSYGDRKNKQEFIFQNYGELKEEGHQNVCIIHFHPDQIIQL